MELSILLVDMELSILLVDDEPKVLRGLRTIIDRANEDWIILGECRNGFEAVDFICKNKPDVVITDIKMPGMSGLELIEKTKSIAPDLKFIVLSGYPDFKYAQQAIRLETVDYILKPPDYTEILKVIKKIEQQKINKSVKLREEEKLKQDKLFYELLYNFNSISKNSRLDLNNFNIFSKKFAVFIIKLDNFSFSSFDITDERLKKLSELRDELQKLIYDLKGCAADFYDGIFCCLINITNNNGDEVKGLARDIKNTLYNKFQESVTIGISRVYDSPEKVNTAYRECLCILRNKVFYKKSSIICIDEIKSHYGSVNYPYELERKYIESLIFSDRKKSIELLKDIINKLISTSNSEEFRNLILEFVIIVIRNLSETSAPDLSKVIRSKDICNKLNSADNISDIELLLISFTESIIDYFNSKNKPSCGRIVNEIKQYVNNNYFSDISLRQLANQFFMNESYLSDLFKKETGISFTKYLTTQRIENAKLLLNQIDLKIYDVAAMVGYNNQRYFNAVFKKATGLTPFEYRERAGNS